MRWLAKDQRAVSPSVPRQPGEAPAPVSPSPTSQRTDETCPYQDPLTAEVWLIGHGQRKASSLLDCGIGDNEGRKRPFSTVHLELGRLAEQTAVEVLFQRASFAGIKLVVGTSAKTHRS